MGWRYRKSYKLGGFRINLSKSGIGYSCGIPGMRFTKMANGRERTTYSIPGTGFFYVEETSSKNKNKPNNTAYSTSDNTNLLYEASADVEEYQNVEYDEFLSNVRKYKKKNDNYNLIMIITGILGLFFISLLILPLIMFIYRKCNEEQFKINADYSFDEYYQDYYNLLNLTLEEITKNDKVWAIESEHSVDDRRYNAGAGSSVKRQAVKLEQKCPQYLKMNITPYYLSFKNNSFYFLPDRILLETAKQIKDIKYSELKLNFNKQRFIEDEKVPKDALIVDRTWKYVNKNGTPDRRFNNNYQIPICSYSTVNFYSESGLNIMLHLSNNNSADIVQVMYNNLVKKRLDIAYKI